MACPGPHRDDGRRPESPRSSGKGLTVVAHMAQIVIVKAPQVGLSFDREAAVAGKETAMRRARWVWRAVLSVLAVAVVSLVLTGCGDKTEPAAPKKPAVEPVKSKKEHPTSEHPKKKSSK